MEVLNVIGLCGHVGEHRTLQAISKRNLRSLGLGSLDSRPSKTLEKLLKLTVRELISIGWTGLPPTASALSDACREW